MKVNQETESLVESPILDEVKYPTYEEIKKKIIKLHGDHAITDIDIALLCEINTSDLNEIVKNNLNHFPKRCVIELTYNEKTELVENFDRFYKMKHSTVLPLAFTEDGLGALLHFLAANPRNFRKRNFTSLKR